jgi:hypothetical protein
MTKKLPVEKFVELCKIKKLFKMSMNAYRFYFKTGFSGQNFKN